MAIATFGPCCGAAGEVRQPDLGDERAHGLAAGDLRRADVGAVDGRDPRLVAGQGAERPVDVQGLALSNT